MNPSSEPTQKKYLAAAGALFHRKRHRLDFVRDPYKAWLLGCFLFVILLLASISLDGWITFTLENGSLAARVMTSPVPPPIIDQNLLSKTAQLYAGKTAALIALESTTPAIADPAVN